LVFPRERGEKEHEYLNGGGGEKKGECLGQVCEKEFPPSGHWEKKKKEGCAFIVRGGEDGASETKEGRRNVPGRGGGVRFLGGKEKGKVYLALEGGGGFSRLLLERPMKNEGRRGRRKEAGGGVIVPLA